MHSQQLADHGGSDGMRDETLLDSALAKPLNVFAYADEPDLFRLAASYAFGIARNHAFVDGNKRIAIVAAGLFLELNGYRIETSDAHLYNFVLGVAAGEIDEDGATRFLRDFTVPL